MMNPQVTAQNAAISAPRASAFVPTLAKVKGALVTGHLLELRNDRIGTYSEFFVPR